MADSYITDLPVASDFNDSDSLLVDQAGTARMLPGELLKDYVNRNIMSITVTKVASTAPARVVDFDPATGTLSIEIPQGIGIKSIAPKSTSGLQRTYKVTLDDESSYDVIFYDGNGISNVVLTAGDHSSGTIDTYTINFTNGTSTQFYVYNGRDGAGQVNTVDGVGVDSSSNLNVSLGAMRLNGSVGRKLQNFDVNNFLTGVAFVEGSTCTNAAFSVNHVLISGGLGNEIHQIAVCPTSYDYVLTRFCLSGTWGQWEKLYSSIWATVSMPTASWVADSSGDYYTQTVTVKRSTGATITGSDIQVDLQADTDTILQMLTDGTVSLYVENNTGTFIAYAVGGKPSVDLTVKAMATEISLL